MWSMCRVSEAWFIPGGPQGTRGNTSFFASSCCDYQPPVCSPGSGLLDQGEGPIVQKGRMVQELCLGTH
jgi:hypothetical protein